MLGIGDFIKGVFGDKGLVGQVIDTLKSAGVIKDLESEQKAKVAILELEYKTEALAVRQLEAINKTMQAEMKSEGWFRSSWRPMVGYTFSVMIFLNHCAIPLVGQVYGLQPITIPGEVYQTMLVVLGISAGTRGWEKIVRARNGANK